VLTLHVLINFCSKKEVEQQFINPMKVGKYRIARMIISFGRILKMKLLSCLIPVCFMVMFAEKIFAQQHFFSNYTVDEGLSNNAVGCIVKDKDGYIWAGTEGGLNRFNGYDFTVYKSVASDSTTLSSNAVHCLLTDDAGNVWVGTSSGICLFNKKSNAFIRLSIRSPHRAFVSQYATFRLMEDSEKNIWAGVSDMGLVKYDHKQHCFVQAIERMPPLSNNMINGIAEDKDGTLWLLSYKSLLHFNPEKGTIKEFENRISADFEFQGLNIFKDETDENFLWIATWGSGLVHFNKQNGSSVSYKFHSHGTKNLHNIVFDMNAEEKNILWLATSEGIIVFDTDKKEFEGFVRDSLNTTSPVNGETRCIYKDNEGITWMGSAGGFCNIHPAKQNFVKQPLWLHAPVTEYYIDEPGNKIYGVRIYSDRCLVIYDRKKNIEEKYKIPMADELGAEPFSVVKDNDGLIWIGTTKGIYTFNELQKKFSLFDIEKQLHIPNRSLYVRQALKDSTGNLWFSCYAKGLLMVHASTKKITPWLHDEKNPASFPLYAMTSIAAGRGNTLYICDEQRGAVAFDYGKRSWIHFDARQKKYSVLYDAADIAADRNGCIWVTTRNNGLVCIDKNHEAAAYLKDDFGNIIDEQNTLAIDDSGKIWFTASNGMYRFNSLVKSFMNFTLKDGLPARTAPLHHLDSGKIALHVLQGIFCFDPLKVSKTGEPLHVHLTSLSINGKPSAFNSTIDLLDTITLEHTENNLTLEFAATDFAYPSSVLYSYKLEGIDNSWSAPAKTRTVNFSHLAPGNYWLRIRAGENFPDKKIFISIIPAWWQTRWFRWFTAAVVLSILFFSTRYYLSFRYRQKIAALERQREIENIRIRISRDIHDEIGSGLTKIKLMSRNLLKAKEKNAMVETTEKISFASDELIQNLGEIVWTINPANDTLENVFAFVRNYVSKLFDGNSEIKLKLDFTEPDKIPPHIIINPEVKRNFLLILKEALTNIFKHSQATEVTITLHADKSKIEMQINDNGVGFQEERSGAFGNGLKNMRKRAESINAAFTIDKKNHSGTFIKVSIPLV
jgi:signal transduction histidine kinase/ligand-binding sensor domain-containing protein